MVGIYVVCPETELLRACWLTVSVRTFDLAPLNRTDTSEVVSDVGTAPAVCPTDERGRA
jgi:hypothetical protein